MNNYSDITKNNYQIIDLFKRFNGRIQRIQDNVEDNKEKFFRNLKTNRLDLEQQMADYVQEKTNIEKKGLEMAQNAGGACCKPKTNGPG